MTDRQRPPADPRNPLTDSGRHHRVEVEAAQVRPIPVQPPPSVPPQPVAPPQSVPPQSGPPPVGPQATPPPRPSGPRPPEPWPVQPSRAWQSSAESPDPGLPLSDLSLSDEPSPEPVRRRPSPSTRHIDSSHTQSFTLSQRAQRDQEREEREERESSDHGPLGRFGHIYGTRVRTTTVVLSLIFLLGLGLYGFTTDYYGVGGQESTDDQPRVTRTTEPTVESTTVPPSTTETTSSETTSESESTSESETTTSSRTTTHWTDNIPGLGRTTEETQSSTPHRRGANTTVPER
ncbi:MAG: hypothetical protein QM809_08635 [Gordonia sp. (in: high G+C Gram-positive bacteria)]|uniref:hypothetical protein n=1 Tax=Gordonia sp. (in: high G+C Gram-positive bacteria) TaxID=84139 RepID=UPI0039E7158C